MKSSKFRSEAKAHRQWQMTGDNEVELLRVSSATSLAALRESAEKALASWLDALPKLHEAIPTPMQGQVHHGFSFWVEEVTYETRS